MSRPAIITLTTDFGSADPYPASMKGAILALNPQATIVDITHAVHPQRIEEGAFVLAAAWPYFPAGAIHVAVVDPGVGSQRRPLALQTPHGFFLGPDNGILSAALPDQTRQQATHPSSSIRLPSQIQAVLLSNQRFHRQPVSPTFHGRDLFAPVAAHLSLGVLLPELGPPTNELLALPPFRAAIDPEGALAGRVIHIDNFGNLVTDVRQDQLPQGQLTVELKHRVISGLSRSYAEGQGLVAVIGSTGFLEIALRDGNAARELHADIGEPVRVFSTG